MLVQVTEGFPKRCSKLQSAALLPRRPAAGAPQLLIPSAHLLCSICCLAVPCVVFPSTPAGRSSLPGHCPGCTGEAPTQRAGCQPSHRLPLNKMGLEWALQQLRMLQPTFPGLLLPHDPEACLIASLTARGRSHMARKVLHVLFLYPKGINLWGVKGNKHFVT